MLEPTSAQVRFAAVGFTRVFIGFLPYMYDCNYGIFAPILSIQNIIAKSGDKRYQRTTTCRGCRRQLCTTQPHRNSFTRRLRFRATSVEVAAPTTIEKRDAHAPCVILTRLLARREVGDFARRLATVDLTSARVAFGVVADIRPGAFRGCGVYTSVG